MLSNSNKQKFLLTLPLLTYIHCDNYKDQRINCNIASCNFLPFQDQHFNRIFKSNSIVFTLPMDDENTLISKSLIHIQMFVQQASLSQEAVRSLNF